MKAGRELDALVAENVMGMAEPEWIPTHEEVASAYMSASRSKWDRWPWEINYWGREKPIRWEPKRFSTDIAAAWEVVEKVGQVPDGKAYCDEGFALIWHDVWLAGWRMWDRDNGMEFGIEATAATAPHAMCLAALKTKGIES